MLHKNKKTSRSNLNNQLLRLEIPFYSGHKFYCAQACIKMALKYFYPHQEFTYKELAQKSVKHKKFGTFSVGLAKALAESGLDVSFFTSSLKQNNQKQSSIEYYKKYKNFLRIADKLIDNSIKCGVIVEEKNFKLEEIIEFFTREYIMIPLLNWKVIKGEKGFQGHFVVISGMDSENIYVHNPGPNHPEPFMQLEKKVFYNAWSSLGTDKDIVVVKGKNQYLFDTANTNL